MSDELIPLPRPTALSQPHWQGCKDGKLKVQRCADCGSHIFIPQPRCNQCQADALEWVESSGRGTVYSFTVVHRPPKPQFEVPYVVAIIALEEGWHMLSIIVDCPVEHVAVDMPVRVTFRRMTDEITLPYFTPA